MTKLEQMGDAECVYQIIRNLDRSPDKADTNPGYASFVSRSSGRFMEEAVELCLAHGLTAREIMGHVMDALHNEARKAGVYPTEIGGVTYRHERIIELGDVSLMIQYLALIGRIGANEIDEARRRKVDKMAEWAATGEAHVIRGLFYRKSANR